MKIHDHDTDPPELGQEVIAIYSGDVRFHTTFTSSGYLTLDGMCPGLPHSWVAMEDVLEAGMYELDKLYKTWTLASDIENV